jgi:diguanylate cyclase (GGDEF)-like protein
MTTSTRDTGKAAQTAPTILGPPQGPRAPEQVAAAARPNAPRPACLIVVAAPDSGGFLGRRFELGNVTRIGSADDNDVVLGIEDVAVHHARIEWRATAYHLVAEIEGDRSARTLLGDRLLQSEAALRHRDKLKLGCAGLELLEAYTKDGLDAAYHDCIYRLTIIDEPTGTFNERYLREAVSREMNRSLRQGIHMALAIFKVDDLARINVAYGHRVRDEALRAIAQRLMEIQLPCDIVARLGADELAVMMPGTSAAVARERADAIRLAIGESSIALDSGPIQLMVSAGIAMREEGDKNAADLVAHARKQVDDSRRAGRDLTREG